MIIVWIEDADVNNKDENGSTPLIEASDHGHEEIVQLLINAGRYISLLVKKGSCHSSAKLPPSFSMHFFFIFLHNYGVLLIRTN